MTTIVALALLLSQVAAPGPENWAYVTCMISSASESLKDNPSRAEFQRRLQTMCKEEEAPLRRLIMRNQLDKGRSRTQAEADAEGLFAEIRLQMLSLEPVDVR